MQDEREGDEKELAKTIVTMATKGKASSSEETESIWQVKEL